MPPTSKPNGAVPVVPRTARGQRRRSQLIEAARVVFERDGFVQTRVADIVAEAGIAHGTFYIYFDSKEAVFHAVIVELMEQISADAHLDAEEANAVAAVEAANRSYIAAFQRHAPLMLLWEDVAGYNTTIDDLLQTQIQSYIDRTERRIRQLQADGFADLTLDPEYTAIALCSMVREFCTQWFAAQRPIDLDQAVSVLTALWTRGIDLDPAAPHRHVAR